jgi:hypothetical protein
MLDGGRLWKLGDGLNSGGKGADPLGCEAVSEELHL